MRQYDPFRLSDELKQTFIRYLLDAHRSHESQQELRQQFQAALCQQDLFVREPLVSIIPSYRHGTTPEELLRRKDLPMLHPSLRRLSRKEFDLDRPLYTHQVQAIHRIEQGRNTVVASGTGSGKTECFLLPILHHAVGSTAKGVQAVIVYPMNALANDQWRRLRDLVGETSATFGRYTGPTPESPEDAKPEELAKVKHPNERYTRQQIRSDPPQLLLTNFAMLEYLLLRPQDQDIFRHRQVRFVVLDEAHTYTGAQGIDVGLLMRRFQGLFPHRLQFILTSATLGSPSERGVRTRIARFAHGLCGGEFAEDDVIFGETGDPFDGRSSNELTSDQVGELAKNRSLEMLSGGREDLVLWLRSIGLLPSAAKEPSNVLYDVLRDLKPVQRLYDRLRLGPSGLQELCQTAFPGGGSQGGDGLEPQLALAVRWLLCASALAKPAFEHASPLLGARVHHFFRGLSGATVDLRKKGDTAFVSRVYLEDRRLADDGLQHVMPLSTCVHCGMPVVSVAVQEGRWHRRARGVPDQTIRLLTWFQLEQADQAGESDEQGDGTTTRWAFLSPTSGAYQEGAPPDDPAPYIRLAILDGVDDEGNLRICPNCGGVSTPFPSVLREFSTGEDAPTALLAEELVRAMPEEDPNLPAGGRRLLAFSDSRQRAAYFTPYLTRTAAEPSYVQPILAAAKSFEAANGRAGTVREVLGAASEEAYRHPWVVVRQTDSDGFDRYKVVTSRSLSPDDRRQLLNELGITLYQHLAASANQRTKLFGMGLLGRDIELTDQEWSDAASAAKELFRNAQVGQDAVCRLLLYVVRRGAVEYWPSSITHANLISTGQGPGMVSFHMNPVPGLVNKRLRVRWNPYQAPPNLQAQAIRRSRTAPIVRQALSAQGGADDRKVSDVLDGLWAWLTGKEILRLSEPGEFRLPAGRILLRSSPIWYRCQQCNSLTIHPMANTCEVSGCQGQLSLLDKSSLAKIRDRHLARRYAREPLPLVVREHTAQLTLERGGEYQDRFIKGEINVLSSSTTFEMGVDVGQLQAVLLRNVPPTAANYIQRAGRAGRRKKGVAHAITYARSIPHDQHHFFSPTDIVAGNVPVPVIYTANVKLTQRHLNSFLLGKFLLVHRDQLPSGALAIQQFFPAPDASGDDSLSGLFTAWCSTAREDLLTGIAAVIPQDCPLAPEKALEDSVAGLTGRPDGDGVDAYHRGLVVPLREYARQREELNAEIMTAMKEGKPRKAQAMMIAMQRILRLEAQLLGTSLIDFLSEQHWLPSYAFPQDVVKLTVRNAEETSRMRLERDRERGISEYAPGSEIIADGKLFTSVGINLEKREPDLKWFSMDVAGRRILLKNTKEEVLAAGGQRPMEFVEPLGFTTMWDASAEEPNLFRLRPAANTDVFLIEGASGFEPCKEVPGVLTGRSTSRLFRANLGGKGRGFMICLRCGLGWGNSGKPPGGPHSSPWGGTCSGSFQRIALAHIFETDVLQVRFPGHPTPSVKERPFWATLTAAFLASASEELSIDRGDLDATYRGGAGEEGELIVYDRVPGGAGHAERIRSSLLAILGATLDRLARCPNPQCDPEASCYTCLRSYRNQFQWDVLQRSAPLPWIQALCVKTKA